MYLKIAIFGFTTLTWLFCISTQASTSKLRKRALEGVKDLRNLSAFRAVKEAAWDEMRHKRYYSALKKLKYHQQLQPKDVEAYYLEGVCLSRLERWKDAYIAYHKAYYLSGKQRYRDLMFEMKAKAGKPVVREKPWYLKIKDPNEKKVETPELKVEIPVATKMRGSYLQLSRMRMLQSLLDRYESVYGPMEVFNLDSLLKDKVTSRPINIKELGKITLKNSKIHSENFGTIDEIRSSMQFFMDAVSMASKNNTSDAIRSLEKNQDKLIRSEAEYLISLYRQEDRTEDELAYRKKLAERFPAYTSNLLVLADYHYENGRNQKALEYYQKIIDLKSDNSMIRRRIRQLKAGGTFRLREILKGQRKTLLGNEGIRQ
tara:strand:+ start:813 stop:1931 length:1119 start_codon:yes stop_codon:yes gene_type:complete